MWTIYWRTLLYHPAYSDGISSTLGVPLLHHLLYGCVDDVKQDCMDCSCHSLHVQMEDDLWSRYKHYLIVNFIPICCSGREEFCDLGTPWGCLQTIGCLLEFETSGLGASYQELSQTCSQGLFDGIWLRFALRTLGPHRGEEEWNSDQEWMECENGDG